jgi:hypothetical protein
MENNDSVLTYISGPTGPAALIASSIRETVLSTSPEIEYLNQAPSAPLIFNEK